MLLHYSLFVLLLAFLLPLLLGGCDLKATGVPTYLLRKGIVQDLGGDLRGLEWERWIPREPGNARTVVCSLLPSIDLKSLWYSLSVEDALTNFRSVFLGIGWTGYPLLWWKAPLGCFIDHTQPGLPTPPCSL